jgi:hypothetical protein
MVHSQLCRTLTHMSFLDYMRMTSNGEQPTPFNTCPATDADEGRGSLVWFNQALSLQSAHLLFDTVAECWHNGVPTSFEEVCKVTANVFPSFKS